MPLKEFQIWIDGFTFIRARRLNRGSDILSFAIVLMALDGEVWVDPASIRRTDTRIGMFLVKKGLLEKIWYRDLGPDEVFALAIETFRNESDSIREQFLRN